ncbi:member of Set1p complex, histone methyl transferase [Scheffersomyces stipitis CBS 6054]|uniref:Member of Set1p complex, histone methyl transferase n=1 Tax=Scheffersomyces stipitis (strain ATCC 58785 / CBS 6054 / NBRC 10063 / NRRL Y-11545) TaxID=322104 RepID=A3LWT0_PICST|nr:member of Set1p complex, histone methyl transferase [Scheffersomyces stipitis CBS 6054]ABN67693.2 member of Set1p complex, histone methyl transferase [Scheffersomyces stipitis CBS 6054]
MFSRPSSSSSSSTTTPITDKVIASFRPAKTFNYHREATITSLDFDDSGQYLISAGIDKSIQLYDIHKGVHHKDIQSQKYGAHVSRFAHHELNCLYASTPTPSLEVDNGIRYLSLGDNKYIRYFKGHKEQVTSIEVNPVQNIFLSASMDYSVKLWDFKSTNPVGNLDVGQKSVIAFDPQGIIFAVGKSPSASDPYAMGNVGFYDIKNMDAGPFLSVDIPSNEGKVWSKLEFSNNGKSLLVSTDSYEHYIIDSFSGQLLTTLSLKNHDKPTDYWMSFKYPFTASSTFSPCGKFVLAGSPNGSVSVFDLNSLRTTDGNTHMVTSEDNPIFKKRQFVLPSGQGIPKIIAFNPKLLTFATADNTVTLWSPNT